MAKGNVKIKRLGNRVKDVLRMPTLTKVILIVFATTLVLSGTLFLFINYHPTSYGSTLPNKEYPQIYIRSNGNIETNGAISSDVPISCNSNLYTLNADVELQKMVIEKSDIILDGNGYSVSIVGPGSYKNGWNLGHLDVLGAKNVTLRNLTFADTQLTFEDSSSCKVVNNNFISILLKNCSDIFVSENTRQQGGCSVGLIDTRDCTISNSTVDFFWLTNSNNNKLLNNNMTMIKQLALQFVDSSSNLFFGNRIERSIKLFEITGNSGNNLFVGNFIQGSFNEDPILKCSGVNTFYHNNFIYVYWTKTLTTTHNMWDNGSEGNYWNDGVGNSPHIIDANNRDRYPLTSPLDLSLEPQPQTLP